SAIAAMVRRPGRTRISRGRSRMAGGGFMRRALAIDRQPAVRADGCIIVALLAALAALRRGTAPQAAEEPCRRDKPRARDAARSRQAHGAGRGPAATTRSRMRGARRRRDSLAGP